MLYFTKLKARGEIVWKSNAFRKQLNFLLLLAVGLYCLPAQAKNLKVCYDQWPPMTIFPTSQEPRRGVVIDMLSDIYRQAGYTLTFFEVPLGRGISMIAEGLCDILPEYVFSPNDENDFVYAKQASFVYTTAFIVRRGDPWRYSGIDSIVGKRIATGPGWNYSSMSQPYQDYLDDPKNHDKVEVVAGNDDVVDRILNMMVSHRVDLYADNVFVLKYVLNHTGLNDQLEIVLPGLEGLLVEKPIFSLKLPLEKRQRLMEIWDKGRKAILPAQESKYLKSYGIEEK
jgi:polar amino acid transport system substrate-binding protein